MTRPLGVVADTSIDTIQPHNVARPSGVVADTSTDTPRCSFPACFCTLPHHRKWSRLGSQARTIQLPVSRRLVESHWITHRGSIPQHIRDSLGVKPHFEREDLLTLPQLLTYFAIKPT